MISHSNFSSPSSYSNRPFRRGKCKIFIGMAPGVGKTCRMLEEAHLLKKQGTDVVIGLLETHGREETAQRVKGLELIPRQKIHLSGIILTEMDTDAILARSPQLVLVDELAHNNFPGSLREKRYQDMEVLLAAGINVYATVNIQHLESLNDSVAQITGVVVPERIPDRVIEEADEVVVVDVTPETLQERLLEGKIYAPAKIQESLKNFFQRRNLIALRELALRKVADNVEEDAVEFRARYANACIPATQLCNIHERVLVCVSTYPNSIQLLRRGASIAGYMNAPLYAVFIDHPEQFLTKEDMLHVKSCENLCQEFGGTFIRVTSDKVVKGIAEVANKNHITQIVVGESKHSRWELLIRGALTQQLVRLLKNVDLHIISTDQKAAPSRL